MFVVFFFLTEGLFDLNIRKNYINIKKKLVSGHILSPMVRLKTKMTFSLFILTERVLLLNFIKNKVLFDPN